jgi:2-dehydropantoate 2-reductase
MHFVIYGAGAVGGVIGSHLFRVGIPTTLVARGAHLEAIQARGLALDTANGLCTLPIPAVRSAAEIEWRDDSVVLLCVKSHQTEQALNDLLAHAPRDTPVVSAQNGVANEQTILRRFQRTYAICVVLPATHLEPGLVVQGSGRVPGILDVGRFPSGTDSLAESVAAHLRAASFGSEVRDDIMAWKYRKLIRNLGNGVDAGFRRGPAADLLHSSACAEGEAVLAAAGIDVVSDEVDAARRTGHIIRRRILDDAGTSTWQSVARGTDGIEIDYLAGEIVLLGRLYGVPTPVNELIQSTTTRLAREQLPAGSLDPVAALQALGLASAGEALSA